VAMLRVHETLKRHAPDVKMTLQVHDELVLEVPERQAQHVAELVRAAMEGAFPMTVPLKVDVKTGRNWDEAKSRQPCLADTRSCRWAAGSPTQRPLPADQQAGQERLNETD
jgi:hypothetical protein